MKPLAPVWHERATVVAPALVIAALLALALVALALTMDASEREAAAQLMQPRWAVLVMLWALASLAGGWAARRAWQRWIGAPARWAEALRVRLADAPLAPSEGACAGIDREADAGVPALQRAVAELLRQRDALRGDLSVRVAEATRHARRRHERHQSALEALIGALAQGVVVCNRDGRVLLFNARARLEFRRADDAARPVGGADALALGRSIDGLLDRRLLAHALELLRVRLRRGAEHPSAALVAATNAGRLLQVTLAPVRLSPDDPAAPLDGFVLLIEPALHDGDPRVGIERRRDERDAALRSDLGRLQMTLSAIEDEVDPAATWTLHAELRVTVTAMARRLHEADAERRDGAIRAWPLHEMLAADLVAAAARRIEAEHAVPVEASETDASARIRADVGQLIQVLMHLAAHLVDEHGVARFALRLAADARGVALDLVWPALAISGETIVAWQSEPMAAGGAVGPLSIRDVVDRHDGEIAFERARVRPEMFVRLRLPALPPLSAVRAGASSPEGRDKSGAGPAATVPHERPAFVDFDLFEHRDPALALADRSLADLDCTVFDTETTGLDPSGGDEIIQIGAVRIVAGKLRRGETFDQLVDPQRSVPAAGIAVHGIEPALLRGQPTIGAVLPAFHAFAHDAVLVAHNAAFDLKFLQLKEPMSGLRFGQPVLDTMLLSQLLHPHQVSHRLEAIAERLGVPVLGRHTALGDALLTAELFVRMVPLLGGIGIVTLGQALEASRRTQRARLRY